MICYSLRTFSYKIFELSIPAGRLEEIYEEMIIPTEFLSRRFSEISFEDRFAHFLKVSRKRLGLFDSYYVGAAVDFRSLQFAKPPKFKQSISHRTASSHIAGTLQERREFQYNLSLWKIQAN